MKNIPATILERTMLLKIIEVHSTHTHAASQPKTWRAPCSRAQDVWKYGIANPPRVLNRFNSPLTSPGYLGKQSLAYESTHYMLALTWQLEEWFSSHYATVKGCGCRRTINGQIMPYSQTAAVLIITAISLIPQPNITATTESLRWKAAPDNTKPAT